uniref:G-strand telomere binding protein 1 n=2 Tax=Ulva partita TaxID=1605170 RepID=A0A1C9ZWA0_9CHLO|nr:G-strand telomere binding protein 1 [Ulva partita]
MTGEESQPVPQGRRCFVSNLAWRTSWQDLKDHFKSSGNVVFANVMQDTSGRSKGWGIVEFETAEQAADACATKNGSRVDGRILMVREDREDRDVKRGNNSASHRAGESSGMQVVVHGIPWSFDDQQLMAIFTDRIPSTQIESAEVVYGRDSRSRGYGTVKFLSSEDAQLAIQECDGLELQGRLLSVKLDQWG